MADKPAVHIGENSPEWVAYKLMWDVLSTERDDVKRRTKETYLDTYAECLHAVRGYRDFTTRNSGS